MFCPSPGTGVRCTGCCTSDTSVRPTNVIIDSGYIITCVLQTTAPCRVRLLRRLLHPSHVVTHAPADAVIEVRVGDTPAVAVSRRVVISIPGVQVIVRRRRCWPGERRQVWH